MSAHRVEYAKSCRIVALPARGKPLCDNQKTAVATMGLFDELHGCVAVDDATLKPAFEKQPHRAPTAVAVVQRPIVHIPADEGIGLGPIKASGVLHSVIERTNAVFQTIGYAVAKVTRDLQCQVIPEVLPDDVPTKRQRQP